MSEGERDRRRPLALLYIGQACAFATVFLGVFAGPFAVREMTGSFALGGLPVAMYPLASLLVIVPAGRLMDRIGRGPVLALGHVAGAAGASAVALSLGSGSVAWAVPAFLAGLFLLSAGSGIAFLARVAVSDLYPPDSRGRGIGRFVLASFAGSLVGAGLYFALGLEATMSLSTAYVLMVPPFVAGAVSMALLGLGPGTATGPSPAGRGTRAALRRPFVAWAILGNAGAQSGMSGVMSLASAALASAPGVAMGGVMLSHFGGMFLPSPLAGRLSDRFGRPLSILAGGLVLALGSLLFTRPDPPWIAAVGLFAVGAGWCLTYVPGTALLADAVPYEERGSLIGANDMIVAVVGAAVTLLAGAGFALWGPAGLAAIGAACAAGPVAAAVRLRAPRTGVAPLPQADP